jgi:hypothetical protein
VHKKPVVAIPKPINLPSRNGCPPSPLRSCLLLLLLLSLPVSPSLFSGSCRIPALLRVNPTLTPSSIHCPPSSATTIQQYERCCTATQSPPPLHLLPLTAQTPISLTRPRLFAGFDPLAAVPATATGPSAPPGWSASAQKPSQPAQQGEQGSSTGLSRAPWAGAKASQAKGGAAPGSFPRLGEEPRSQVSSGDGLPDPGPD